MPGFTCILPFDGKVNVLVCWQFEIMVFEILLSQRTRGFLIPHSLRAFVPDTKGKREMYLSRRVSLLHLFYPLVPVPLASRRLSGTDFDQPPEVTAADGREKKPGLRNIPNHQVGFLPLFQGGIACFAKDIPNHDEEDGKICICHNDEDFYFISAHLRDNVPSFRDR